jgi:hypothetical protein
MACLVTTTSLGTASGANCPAVPRSSEAPSGTILLLPSLQLLAETISHAYDEESRSSAVQAVPPTPRSIAEEQIRNKEEESGSLLRGESYSEQDPEPKPETAKSSRKKTGRKPCPLTCFLCSSVLPYKCELISHLRTVHAISRSLSLMYKRINQGGEEIRRLYCPQPPVKGPRKQIKDS